jgi:MFS family permease
MSATVVDNESAPLQMGRKSVATVFPTEVWKPSFNPWLIAAAVMLATFMEVLHTSVANVSLPHIAGSLSATTDESTWVLTSYLVSNAIVLPATSWPGHRFGRSRFLIVCIAVFTLSSALCGAAGSLGMLLFARVLQGAGGGALQPIAQAVLLESFPAEKRGSAMAVYGMGIVVAPIIGPTLGGWITDNYSWRWIFYINVPIGILAVLMAHTFIKDPPYIRNQRPGRIDYTGFGLMALGLASLRIVLDKGQEADWFSSSFISGLAVSPRGIGSVISMLIVGRLVAKIDGRCLIIFGFLVLGLATYSLADINLQISIASVAWPQIISGFAMGFVFVPLTVMAMGTLTNEQMGNATGIFSLMRNLGGSFGIAGVTTMLARGAQVHQAAMVQHLTSYDPVFQRRLHELTVIFAAQSNAVSAGQRAYGAIHDTLDGQATLLAYIDNFRLLALLCLLCIPAVLLSNLFQDHAGGAFSQSGPVDTLFIETGKIIDLDAAKALKSEHAGGRRVPKHSRDVNSRVVAEVCGEALGALPLPDKVEF